MVFRLSCCRESPILELITSEIIVNTTTSTRLNKFISDSGHCSRREADKLIEQKRVTINGRLPKLGTKVEDGDEVAVDGFRIKGRAVNKSDRVYLVYYKPIGITSTTEQGVRGNIVDAIDHDERIFPVGRLDKMSEGLIFLTSDGDIVNKILRAENSHEKEYLVTVDKSIDKHFALKMSQGIPILNTTTKPCKVNIQSRSTFSITLTQGLNRQIRRMCEYLGYEVKQLRRVRIMNVQLGKLKPGQWRNLTREEMIVINNAIADSAGNASKSGTSKSGSSKRSAGGNEKQPIKSKKQFKTKPDKLTNTKKKSKSNVRSRSKPQTTRRR